MMGGLTKFQKLAAIGSIAARASGDNAKAAQFGQFIPSGVAGSILGNTSGGGSTLPPQGPLPGSPLGTSPNGPARR